MRRHALGLAPLLLAAAVILATALTGTATAAPPSVLRLTHLSPDTPSVNVTITSSTGRSYLVDDFDYGNVTTYQAVEPGTYTVQMRLTADPAAAPVSVGTVQAGPSMAYTAAVLGERAGAKVALFSDDLTFPGPGNARVRVVQAALDAGPVTAVWKGTAIAAAVAYGTATGYVNATAGRGSVGVTPASGAPFTLPVDLADGGVYTVVVLQRGPVVGGHVLLDALGTSGTSGSGNGSGSGGSAGGGGTGQYPDDRTPPPTPKSLFEKVGGATDWQSARAALYFECEGADSDSRREGFTEAECKTAADFFLENAKVEVDPNPPQNDTNHCESRWSKGKILVAGDGTTDCKKVFGNDNRPKSTTPPPPPASSVQHQLRTADSSNAPTAAPTPTGATTAPVTPVTGPPSPNPTTSTDTAQPPLPPPLPTPEPPTAPENANGNH